MANPLIQNDSIWIKSVFTAYLGGVMAAADANVKIKADFLTAITAANTAAQAVANLNATGGALALTAEDKAWVKSTFDAFVTGVIPAADANVKWKADFLAAITAGNVLAQAVS